jgi:putative membrane protein insertion efficiency factor
MSLIQSITRFPARVLIFCVRVYQITLSPIFGRQCRFQPTCSNYTIQAIEKYGAIRGTLKGAWRILRCNPFCKGGWDPP